MTLYIGNNFFLYGWPSRDISDLDVTSPSPTRGIIVGVKVHEAREMEPVFGGWNLNFWASNGM
jgi:hypothetical protein